MTCPLLLFFPSQNPYLKLMQSIEVNSDVLQPDNFPRQSLRKRSRFCRIESVGKIPPKGLQGPRGAQRGPERVGEVGGDKRGLEGSAVGGGGHCVTYPQELSLSDCDNSIVNTGFARNMTTD